MVSLLLAIVVGLNQFPKWGSSWSEKNSIATASGNSSSSPSDDAGQLPFGATDELGPQEADSRNERSKPSLDSNLENVAGSKKLDRSSSSGVDVESPFSSHRPLIAEGSTDPKIPPLKLFPENAENSYLSDPKISPRSPLLNGSNSVMAESQVAIAKTVNPGAASPSVAAIGSENSRDKTTNGDKPTLAAEEASGVYVLASDGSPAKRFPTLEAACAAVSDGSAIELRYNGHRNEKPFRLSKKNLTIRAAKGFRPIVDFSPSNATSDAHLRLISVSSGPVLINNVAFEINVPPFLAIDRISLFSVDRSEELKLHGVGLTMNNPGQRPAALFDLSIEPGQMLADMKMSSTGMARDPLKIELTECLVRGHGDLFHVRHTKPGRLSLRDTAIALDGTLLKVEGHSEKPAEQTRLELGLDHVTAVLGQSLIRLDSGDLPRELPPVAVSASNNVLSLSGTSGLIATSGNTSYADFRKLFLWKGEKNFYDRCKIFWSFASGSESLGFDEWKSNGANSDVGASNEKLVWVSGRTDLSQVTPETFTLDRQSDEPNAAVGAATDGNDAGADASKLPRLPGPESRSE